MEARKILTTLFLLSVFSNTWAEKCYNCTSSDNFDCKSNPKNLDKNQYTCEGICLFSNATENIRRWCVQAFNEVPSNVKVQVCTTPDYCNSLPFEFDCISCDSATNSTCTTCKSTVCYSSVDSSGNVKKGCSDCSSETSTCSSCSNAEKCNNQTYCYQCNGTDPNCLEVSSLTKVQQCGPNNICYTKLNSEGYTERGCTSDKLTCEGTSCITCLGDNCNKGVLPSNRLSCLQCNSGLDCNNGTVSGKYCSRHVKGDTCYAYATGNSQMIRGCISDDLLKNCTGKNCETCNTTNCNSWKVNERPSKLNCFQCDNDCRQVNNTPKASLCKAYPFNAEEKCYTSIANNTVKRGCFYDAFNSTSDCKNGTACSTCLGNECNKEPVVSCYDCVNCLSTSANTTVTQCDLGNFCVTKLNGTSLFRGCSAKKCSSGEENCESCESDKCNGGTFPKDRQSCLQCKTLSENDECAIGSNSSLKLCSTYKKGDKCYHYADKNNIIHRGCLADIDEQRKNCSKENHCEECSSTGCNSKPLYLQPSRVCVQCENCTKALPEPKICNSTHLYYVKEECYTQNVTKGGVTITNKGCLLDMISQEACGSNCTRCLTDGCNKHGDDYKEFPDFKCVVCHSKGDNCANEKPKRCNPIPTTLNIGVGCFVEKRGKDVIRDCLTNAARWNTTLTAKTVKTCLTDSCNTMAAPSSSVANHVSTGLLITLIALLFSSTRC